MRGRGFFWAAVLVFLVLPTTRVHAWGPATHVKLASDVLENLGLLPAAVAGILARCRRDYIFGNIAADVVLAKRLSRVKQFCHHWATGFAILEDAETDSSRAFAYGYLSHLAADTVAHGKFLPRQMTLTRTTVSFGHLYWELRADASIGSHYWDELRSLLAEVFTEHHSRLSATLTDTFLPFSMNWKLFYRMNRFVSRRMLQKTMDRWYGWSRWELSDHILREYRAECVQRILDVLSHGKSSEILHEDPNGNAALAYTKLQRRQLRQLSRSGLIAPHILYEAAAVHAPSVRKHHPVPDPPPEGESNAA